MVNDAIATFFHPAATEWPDRLHASSAWNGHIPFAMNLVATTRPCLIVELGTHTGASYCAMCQAVAALNVEAACAAVDTWEGDEHSGRYGTEVLEELRVHHDARYGNFSRLLQMRFDDAVPLFSDASVDLLHIDGCHTYEAVKHDFEQWLPKLSPRGVVLMHDTAERERGFGVWRFWEELQARYRCFAFTHSHGLGIVAVGSEIPEPVARLVAATGADATAVRALYRELGRRLELALDVRRLQAEVASVETYARANEARALENERSIAVERQRVEEAQRRRDEAERKSWAALDAQRKALATVDAERVIAVELRRELDRVCSDLAAIRGSRSWRAIERWRVIRDRVLREADQPRGALGRTVGVVRRVFDRRS